VKTHDHRGNDNGPLISFEVDNILLSRRGAARVVRSIPGATVRRWPQAFSYFRDGEFFCEFLLDGVTFDISEPWGDNSRYLICPQTPRPTEQIYRVRDRFRAALVIFGVVVIWRS
jgi:hypothetical protein